MFALSGILDELSSIADTHEDLDSVPMPVFSLNDSDIMDQKEKSTASVTSSVDPGIHPASVTSSLDPEIHPTSVTSPVSLGKRPPVSPGSDNVQEFVQNLSQLESDLNGNTVHQSKGVDRRIINRQMSRDWEQLELSMEVLDDLMGKSPDQQKSPFLLSPDFNLVDDHQKPSELNSLLGLQPTDNSFQGQGLQSRDSSSQGLDLSDDLDESFVPFKEGFSLEGGTSPAKNVTSDIDKGSGAAQSSTDDLLARFQRLKQKTSQIQNSHQQS
jgi:hypothetical protein